VWGRALANTVCATLRVVVVTGTVDVVLEESVVVVVGPACRREASPGEPDGMDGLARRTEGQADDGGDVGRIP